MERPARDALKSTLWNIDRLNNCRKIADGLEPDVVREGEWFRVSRHAAGVASAYVTQNDLRKRFKDTLETRVKNTRDDASKEWDAEIWVKKV